MRQSTPSTARTELSEPVAANRTPEHEVDPLFVNRWSPRSMTGEALDETEYLPLFEAARWAPSAYNNQHWRFVYATREDEEWDAFLSLLNEGNRSWAADAAVLVGLFSKRTFDHNDEEVATRSFDAGAAWQNLALEGTRRGLAVHPMAGFDWDRIHETMGVPESEYDAETMIAIGERAPPEDLPEDLAERERPSERKPLSEILSRGSFA